MHTQASIQLSAKCNKLAHQKFLYVYDEKIHQLDACTRTYANLLMQELDVLDGLMEHRCGISLRSTHAEVDPSFVFAKRSNLLKRCGSLQRDLWCWTLKFQLPE
jgi:hypothetical protein